MVGGGVGVTISETHGGVRTTFFLAISVRLSLAEAKSAGNPGYAKVYMFPRIYENKATRAIARC